MKVWLRARALVQQGAIPKPLWYDIVEKIPPLPYPGRRSTVKPIVYPEDEFRRAFYTQFAKSVIPAAPLYNNAQKALCDRFVAQAMELVAGGMPRDEALKEAQAGFAKIVADMTVQARAPAGPTDTRKVITNIISDLKNRAGKTTKPSLISPNRRDRQDDR